MTKYLIIDDEFIAHEIIEGYAKVLTSLKLAKNCYDAIEAIEYLNDHTVDLIFLDLNMPKLKGFDFLRTLTHPPKVIVTTAYKEFAIEGYELNIVDYLLKPFSLERFLKAVNKALKAEALTTITDTTSPTDKTIFLKTNKKQIQVNINSILFLESAGNYVKVVTSNQSILVRDKISDLLPRLSSSDFIQVHKSFAIAKQHVSTIEGNRIEIAHFQIPIGAMYRENVERMVNG